LYSDIAGRMTTVFSNTTDQEHFSKGGLLKRSSFVETNENEQETL